MRVIDRSSRAGYRSIFVLTSLANTRWPTRTLRSTWANQNACVVITLKRPKTNSIHTAAWHAWTRTPPLNIVQKAVFTLIHLPTSFICLCHRAILIWGIETWLKGLFLEQTRSTQAPYFNKSYSKILKRPHIKPSKEKLCIIESSHYLPWVYLQWPSRKRGCPGTDESNCAIPERPIYSTSIRTLICYITTNLSTKQR